MKLFEITGFDFSHHSKNLKLILDKKIYLFRGDSFEYYRDPLTGVDVAEVYGRSEARRSQYGNDTLLVIASRWKNIPRRSFSNFASQNAKHAKNFSLDEDLALIIPEDSVQTFAWSPHDFNQGTGEGREIVKKLTMALTSVFAWTVDLIGVHSSEVGLELKDKLVKIGINEHSKITDENLNDVLKFLDSVKDQWSKYISAAKKEEQKLKEYDKQQAAELEKELDRGIFSSVKRVHPKAKSSDVFKVSKFLEELDFAEKLFNKHNMSDFSDILNIEPEDMEIEVLGLSQLGTHLLRADSKADEIWFEGNYLAVKWQGESTINRLKKLFP